MRSLFFFKNTRLFCVQIDPSTLNISKPFEVFEKLERKPHHGFGFFNIELANKNRQLNTYTVVIGLN
jgi:hypothetical protein